MWQQSRVIVLFSFLFVTSQCSWTEEMGPRSPLEMKMALVRNSILTQQPAEAWITSGSALFECRTYPGYYDLAMSVVDAYQVLHHEDLSERLVCRKEVRTGPFCSFDCFEEGLMAYALGWYEDAAEAFQSSTFAPAFEGNPFPHLMKAKALLQRMPSQPQVIRQQAEQKPGSSEEPVLSKVDLQDVLASYEQAINYSINNPPTLFRIRHEQATDLIEKGYLELGIKKLKESRLSGYLLEQAWALGELLVVAWDCKDIEGIKTCWQDMEILLPALQVQPDLPFETLCLNHVIELADMMRGIQQGDRVMQMKMDEKSVNLRFFHEDFMGVVERLKPWILVFPLHQSKTWSTILRETAVLVHLDYYCSQQSLGNFVEAEAGFIEIIDAFSGRSPTCPVIEAWGWLGNALRDQGRIREAQAAYELALMMDIEESQKTANKGYSMDFLQRQVLQGIMPGPVRASHVANYECVLNALTEIEGGEDR